MKRTVLLGLLALAVALASPRAASPIRAMIVDGESAGAYHKWRLTTPVLKKTLEETKLFAVDVVTAPMALESVSGFAPEFSRYGVVVLNYDAPDERWPASLRSSFEEYMKNGGGLVVVHAADNAFAGWKAYNEMIGVGGWRDRNESAGPNWYYNGENKLVPDDRPGRAGSHGARMPFAMVARDTEHPIMKGLPRTWVHQGDELYARLRGPGRNMTVLATAYSDPENRGTGHDEPMLMALRFGRGRVFHTTLGHDINAMSSVDFVVTYQRGAEWAATGAVTQKVPAGFPTATTVSYRVDLAAMDPGFRSGLNPLDAPPR